MTKYTINSAQDSAQNDVSNLHIQKIIDLVNGELFVLLSGNQQTSIYKINTASPGDLTHHAHLSQTQRINILGGNIQYIFVADSDQVYKSASPSSTTYQLLTYADLSIINVLSSVSLSIVKLGTLTVAYSTISGTTKFYPIELNSVTAPVVAQISGSVTFFSDHYQNLLAVTLSDLIWYRMTGTSNLEVKKLSSSKLSSTQRADLLRLFNLAQDVSFDGQSAIIIDQQPSQLEGSLYSVTFNPTASKEFLIVNSVPNSIHLEESVASNLVEPSSIKEYKTSIGCNCVSPNIERFECYAAALKCITVTGPKREACNKV